jgi:hypothetical protein
LTGALATAVKRLASPVNTAQRPCVYHLATATEAREISDARSANSRHRRNRQDRPPRRQPPEGTGPSRKLRLAQLRYALRLGSAGDLGASPARGPCSLCHLLS